MHLQRQFNFNNEQFNRSDSLGKIVGENKPRKESVCILWVGESTEFSQ